MDKQETLNSLYTLRAGLSVISQENDKVHNLEDNAEDSIIVLTKKCPSINYRIDADYNENEEYEYDEDDYDENGDELTEVIKEKTIKFEEAKKQKKKRYLKRSVEYVFSKESISNAKQELVWENSGKTKNKKRNAASIALSVIFAIAFIVICGFLIRHCSIGGKDKTWLGFYGLGILYFALGAVCLFVCFMSFMNISKNNSTKDTVNNIQYYIDNVENIRNSINEQTDNLKKQVQPIQDCCNKLFNTLQQEYSPILDTRDWKHLDLVIFYFETRRADTVKEALQLVDKEMHNRKIIDTIQKASEQICSTIREGFVALNNNITNCFNSLSVQLANQHSQNLVALQALTTSVNLNNALQAKANKSSEQLMNDVKYLRTYICR